MAVGEKNGSNQGYGAEVGRSKDHQGQVRAGEVAQWLTAYIVLAVQFSTPMSDSL